MNDSSSLRPVNLVERLTKAEYEKETLATLKYRLGFRGLIRQGNKQEIVHRLVKDDEKYYSQSRKASSTVSADSPSPQEQTGMGQRHAPACAPPNQPGNLEPRASAVFAPPAVRLKPMEQYNANIPTTAEERKDNHRACAKVHQDILNMLQVCYKMDDDIKEYMRTEEAEAVLLEAIRILETVLMDPNAFFLAGLLVADTLACLQWLNKYWAGAVSIMVEKEKELRYIHVHSSFYSANLLTTS